MKSFRSMVYLMVLGVASCASMSDSAIKFKETTLAYERALRWGNYDMALALHSNETTPLSEQERKRLSHIRVTGYNVINTTNDPPHSRIIQLVELRYYNEDYAVEHKFNTRMEWEQIKDSIQWHIISPFPKFK
ncbi:MAG: hypothetical protein HY080_06635 [Gammaproteobacteria bacterium]|nr:hypothetical protein [Gammaproteobacteria bacterium]